MSAPDLHQRVAPFGTHCDLVFARAREAKYVGGGRGPHPDRVGSS
jgi:hypothetical protein